ncbi:hypothetical protein FRC12_005467 [Ceratobasidium sp. 428]|nr:hypothetical protein FRC12_005467 [Ceratobasidium sp. 428]
MQTSHGLSSTRDPSTQDITWSSLDTLSTVSADAESHTGVGLPGNITWPSPPSIDTSHSNSLPHRILSTVARTPSSTHRAAPVNSSGGEEDSGSHAGPLPSSPLFRPALSSLSETSSSTGKRPRTTSVSNKSSKRPRPSTSVVGIADLEPEPEGDPRNPNVIHAEPPHTPLPVVTPSGDVEAQMVPGAPGSASSSRPIRQARVPKNSPVYRYLQAQRSGTTSPATPSPAPSLGKARVPKSSPLYRHLQAQKKERKEGQGFQSPQDQSDSSEHRSSWHRASDHQPGPFAFGHRHERDSFSPPHTPRGFKLPEPVSPDLEEAHGDRRQVPPTHYVECYPCCSRWSTRPEAFHINCSQVVAYGEHKSMFLRRDDTHLGEVFAQPCHELYEWVFYASLFHFVYRSLDPERILLVFSIPPPHSPHSHFRYGQRPPTHFVGLWPDENGTSVLIWGKSVGCQGSELSVELTMFDSQGTLLTRQDIQPWLQGSRTAIQQALGPHYTVSLTGRLKTWPQNILDAPQRERNWWFCQLISSVVHEFPWGPDRPGTYPVEPVWPVWMVEDRTRALLEQFTTGEVTPHCLLERGRAVPSCVFLHGDLDEIGDIQEDEMSDVDNYQKSADEEDEPMGEPEDVPQQVFHLRQFEGRFAYVKVSRNGTAPFARLKNSLSSEYQEEAPADFQRAASVESM